jgi:catechol 2,3-dioxygenase-like lactoylglutathione lyase family enzyme
MFDHVKFGVSDYAASKAFFLKALEPLGVTVVSEGPPTYGVELSKGEVSLCLIQTEEKPAHLHLAFTAWVRTGTTSKWFATNPRPDLAIELTSPSGLRPCAAALALD